MADPIDATLPTDRDLASSWPALMRETRALLNALIGGAVTFSDGGVQFKMVPTITGQDDEGNNIYAINFEVIPPVE